MTKELTGGRMIDPVFTIKNVLFVIIGTIILLFFTSIAATYLTISDFVIDILVSVITGLSIAFGGFRAARYAGMYGLINGAVFGLIYIFKVVRNFLFCIFIRYESIIFHILNQVVTKLVQDMNTTAVNIKSNIFVFHFKCMNHYYPSLLPILFHKAIRKKRTSSDVQPFD